MRCSDVSLQGKPLRLKGFELVNSTYGVRCSGGITTGKVEDAGSNPACSNTSDLAMTSYYLQRSIAAILALKKLLEEFPAQKRL